MIRHLGSGLSRQPPDSNLAGARTGRTRFIAHAKVMFTHCTVSVYKVPRVPSPSPPSRRGRVSTGSPAPHPRNRARAARTDGNLSVLGRMLFTVAFDCHGTGQGSPARPIFYRRESFVARCRGR